MTEKRESGEHPSQRRTGMCLLWLETWAASSSAAWLFDLNTPVVSCLPVLLHKEGNTLVQRLSGSSMLLLFLHRPWRLCVRWYSCSWQVSSHGRVKASTGVVSHGCLQACGYRRVNINGQHYFVHRLVAVAFLGPPPDEDRWQVNHLDRDRANNRVSNLQYVTNGENQRHAGASNPDRT